MFVCRCLARNTRCNTMSHLTMPFFRTWLAHKTPMYNHVTPHRRREYVQESCPVPCILWRYSSSTLDMCTLHQETRGQGGEGGKGEKVERGTEREGGGERGRRRDDKRDMALECHRRNRNPRPKPQKFSKLVFLIEFSWSCIFLNWLSGALVGVGGSDFVA